MRVHVSEMNARTRETSKASVIKIDEDQFLTLEENNIAKLAEESKQVRNLFIKFSDIVKFIA